MSIGTESKNSCHKLVSVLAVVYPKETVTTQRGRPRQFRTMTFVFFSLFPPHAITGSAALTGYVDGEVEGIHMRYIQLPR